ncbi:lipase family protein [Methylobacterium sp. J-090]|uniref:lipase family protein n=1 Tax=Methylobacterium sp. J-090 TaxID=2836666 RepID=UPI001FBB195C|nr:lipase [Methylobacterium sp. J-090]MCJ2080089.1 lipase [Methylobacterium sp. J-090]
MPPSDAELMTLAGIAYGHPADIPDYLDRDALTHGVWQAVWIARAEMVPVNFAYLTRNLRDGGYAVAIRGTYPNPFSPAYWEDGNQDSPFGPMAEWPSGVPSDPGGPDPQVSGGTWAGFSGLLALQDAAGTTLAQALDRLPADAPLSVTGHSLGGTLAPVLALWLAGRDPGRIADVTTFAGMTPGNGAFAALFGPGTALAGRVRRVYNTLDSVPYGWDDVLATRGFFQPAPQGGVLLDLALHATAWRLRDYGYTAIGTPVPLPGRVEPPSIACTPIAFVIETLHQHMPDTYLGLLGAPPLPFRLGLGAVVAPIDHPVAALLAAHRVPPAYLR